MTTVDRPGPPGSSAPEWAEAPRTGLTRGRIVALLGFVAIAALWIYGFSPLAPHGHPDKLDDAAFVDAAAPICKTAIDEVNAMPQAGEIRDLPDLTDQQRRDLRAEQIETATARLQLMVDDLATVAPTPGTHDGEIVRLWLADWEVFLSDRLGYAADFRAGIDGPFRVTKKDEKPITTPMDGFADANRLQSCITPLDV